MGDASGRSRPPRSRLPSILVSLLLPLLSPTGALAQEVNLDLDITDEASFQSFRGAILGTEYVRNAYVQAPKPRVIGAVAGLLRFATQNPLASDAQLTTFLTEYDTRLTSHAAGDPDLQRGSHLVSALRFELPITGVPDLDGTNSNLGQAAAEILGIDVPPALAFQENVRRIVRFEQARLRALSESPAWANLLILGLSGRDLLGNPQPQLTSVLQTYLTSEGYPPAPPSCVPGCPDIVGDALAANLPVSFAAYQALLADPFSNGGIWDDAIAGFEGINQESIDRLAELTTLMADEPSLVEGIANAEDPTFVAQREAVYLANLGKIADERAIINMNAMLLAQAPDASTRALGDKAQRLARIQVSHNKGLAAATEGVRLVGGAVGFAFAFAKTKKDPVSLARTGTDVVTGALGLGSIFGGGDDEMLDQMVAIRQQLIEMQFQLNGRFDRIERQINTVYDALFDGFDFLGMQLGDIQTNLANANATLEDLERDMAQANASLDRIEDALWTIGDALLQNDLALITNDVLNYRASNGADLSYQNATPNFVTGLSDLFTFATTTAVNDIYAGDDPSTMTVTSAATQLNGASIGRQINDLRVFPTTLGQSALLNTRVAAPSLWAQSASAFAQVARENPWYFAYRYENQLVAPGSPDLDQIIDVGADLQTVASNARNPILFDAIFDAWRTELDPVFDVIDALELLQPASVGDISLTKTVREIAIQGDLAFIAEDGFLVSSDGQLSIVDVSDPTAPALVGSLATTTPVWGVAVRDDLAFLAETGFGLRVIDVNDPTTPVLVGSVATPASSAIDVSIVGERAFVVGGTGLQVIDVSDPTTPIIIGSVATPEISCADGSIDGDLALITCGTRLYAVDISDHTAPFVLSSVALPNAPWDLATSGSMAYVTITSAESLLAIDVSDPTALTIIGSIPAPLCQGLAVDGDRAFVGATGVGLLVIDISDPTLPVLDHTVATAAPFHFDIETRGGFAYVGFFSGGPTLEIVQLSGWPDVLNELDANPSLDAVQTNLDGYERLIEGYITLGMPELMEDSSIVRAALRSDATVGELAVGPARDVITRLVDPSVIGAEAEAPFLANLQRLQDEVDAALLNPSAGHGFVEFVLAELEHLRDNAFKLAVDDTYHATPDGMLTIPVEAGLLANDVDQAFRDIRVDVLFELDPEYVAPQNGSLSLFADGSFEYTPNPRFVGTDSFTYRALTRIDSTAPSACGDPATVCADPATVRVQVPEPGLLWQLLAGGGLLALLGRPRAQ